MHLQNQVSGLAYRRSNRDRMTRRERVFLCRTFSRIIQWWAGWGSRKAGRMVAPVALTLFSSPPQKRLASLGGEYIQATTGGHYDTSTIRNHT